MSGNDANGDATGSPPSGPCTLAIDIGGTGLKASVLDANGKMIVPHLRVPTPPDCKPGQMVDVLEKLVKPLPSCDRISIGFPGVVLDGKVITAPHFHTKGWKGFPLQKKLAERLGKPARLLNDAEVQGLGIISGHGLEVVLTLGTGVGSAIFDEGRMTPHLELAQHPIHKSQTYNEYVGNEARKALGRKKWSRRVFKMIDLVQTLLNYDTLYLGGGNAANLVGKLPKNVRIESNDMGLIGGIHLWKDTVWQFARQAGHGPD
jgi:polyphosphate glucokinase